MRISDWSSDVCSSDLTDDIDAPVAAILEPQNLDARDKRVLDDEMQLAADQLVGALGLEPRREPDLAVLGVVGDPRLQRRIIGAADGNASHMALEHGGEMGSRYEKASPSRSWPFRFPAEKPVSRRASPPQIGRAHG